MKYYKLLKDGQFIGVGSSHDLRRFQIKHSILLTSDDESAQYIQINDILYRDNWFCPTNTDMVDYHECKIIVIDKDEYDALYHAIESGEDINVEDNDDSNQEIEQPIIDEDAAVTVDYVRKAKIAEMSNICNKTITNGFDVTLSDGNNHHFSLTTQDQLNLITLSSMVSNGETAIPYHADGELCKFYSAEDVAAIVEGATIYKTYHVSYYNALKSYIAIMNDISQIGSVYYGIEIPEEYQSDVLKVLLSGNNEED